MSPADAADPSAALRRWLVGQALPTWSATGIDRQAGGFFEAIDLQGRAVEAPRRTRVVARQVYVFATAARRGWLAGADALVDHGLAFMRLRLRRADGSYASSVRPDGTLVDARFDLYEQAFALFALAAARRGRPDRGALHAEALALLQVLRAGWRHPELGFEEAAPRTLPLRSNPHMHLLEAALEWAEVAEPGERAPWTALADELVQLCLARFIDPQSGALREHFDGDWQPMPGAPGRVVEPGHQFEWAWLLMRWAARRGDAAVLTARAAARRLLSIGEVQGVDAGRGVAVNALDDTLCLTDANAKVWPQTERIKAWHAAALHDAADAMDAGDANAPDAVAPDAVAPNTNAPNAAAPTDTRSPATSQACLHAAIAGLTRYLLPAPPGLWHEVMDAHGGFTLQECRASSLYHIVCAIDTLTGTDA